MFCFLENRESRFARDGGKTIEEVLQCFSAREVIEERLDGHTSSAKHGSSA